jgi:preprotein translocase subunit Sec63
MRSGRLAFAALGLEPDATRDDVARAYRRLALLTHPDVSHDPQAAQRFVSLTDAYRRALAEAGSQTAVPKRSTPRWPRTDGRSFVAGPVHVVPQPLRPRRRDA